MRSRPIVVLGLVALSGALSAGPASATIRKCAVITHPEFGTQVFDITAFRTSCATARKLARAGVRRCNAADTCNSNRTFTTSGYRCRATKTKTRSHSLPHDCTNGSAWVSYSIRLD